MFTGSRLALSCAIAALGITGLVSAANPNGDYRMAGRKLTNIGDQNVHVDHIAGSLTVDGNHVTAVDTFNDDHFQIDLTLNDAPLNRGRSVLHVTGGSAGDDEHTYVAKRGVMVFKAGRESRVIYHGRVAYDDDGTDLKPDLVTVIRGFKPLPG